MKVQKLWYQRKFKAAVASVKSLTTNKIGIKASRLEELKQLQEEEAPQEEQALNVAFVNLDEAAVKQLQHSLGYEPAACAQLGEEAWKEALALLASKDSKPLDAVVVKVAGDELRDIERGLLALCFMRSCPAVVLVREGTPAHTDARKLTASTAQVVHDLQQAASVLQRSVPQFLVLKLRVQRDIGVKTDQYKKVHLVKHFSKRAAVALIPFAVSAINFAGMLRLVSNMMRDTGMVLSKPVASSVGKFAGVATLQATAIEQLGDIYQYAVAATILADVGATLVSEGVSAAFASLDAVDFALLGSVSLVTGTLSSIAAAWTRPQLVDVIGSFLATLQVVYLLNPAMRRPQSTALADEGSGDEERERLIDAVDAALASEAPAGPLPPLAAAAAVSSGKKLD